MADHDRSTLPQPLHIARIGVTVALASALIACGTHDLSPDPTRPHHSADGYRNSDGTRIAPSAIDLARFGWTMLTTERAPLPDALRPIVPDLGYLRDNRVESAVTWIGHSTTLLQTAGLNVLTDPHFGERASPVSFLGPKRRIPPALSIDELPPIDVVLISHDHYDHLDEGSVRELVAKRDPLFVVPLGIETVLRAWGVKKVRALDWWGATHVTSPTGIDVEIDIVPAHHWGARGLFDRNERLWGGFVIKAPEFAAFFAGDTGYSDDFKAIGDKFGPFDLAILPVGAYEPRWFMKPQHVDPAEAVQMHLDLKAKRSLGVHWGTFDLTSEPIDAPVDALPKALAAAHVDAATFALFQPGETGIWREPKPADTRGLSPRNPKREWRKGEAR